MGRLPRTAGEMQAVQSGEHGPDHINQKFLSRVAEGLGTEYGVFVEIWSALRAFRVTVQNHPITERVGLVMPVRKQ